MTLAIGDLEYDEKPGKKEPKTRVMTTKKCYSSDSKPMTLAEKARLVVKRTGMPYRDAVEALRSGRTIGDLI